MASTSGVAVPVPAGGFSTKATKQSPLIGVFVDCDEEEGMFTAYSQDNCGTIKPIFSWSKSEGLTEEQVCEIVLSKIAKPSQVFFYAGDTLPEQMETLTVTRKGSEQTFVGGEELSEDFDGYIFIDPCTGVSVFSEMPSVGRTFIYKAGDTMPSFDGFKTVFTSDGEATVYGSGVLPDDMLGAFFCTNGELCYIGSPAAEPIPDEVKVDGSMPEEGSGVELWIDNGIPKTFGPDGWVQTTNYGN